MDAVRVEFQPLVKCEKFEHIRIELKMLLENNPDNDLIGSMHLLVGFAHCSLLCRQNSSFRIEEICLDYL